MNDGRFDDKEKVERRTWRSRREIGNERPRVGRRVRWRTERRNKASETCSGREIRTIENIGRGNTNNDMRGRKFYAGSIARRYGSVLEDTSGVARVRNIDRGHPRKWSRTRQARSGHAKHEQRQ